MLASLIASIATGEAVNAIRRARAAAIVYAFAALAMLCGAGFLIAAAFIAAAARYGSLRAALGFGAGFLILGLLIIGIHRIVSRRRAKRATQRRAEDMKAYAGVAALSLLPVLLKSKPGLAGLVGPTLAAVAYAIYRENRKPEPSGPEE